MAVKAMMGEQNYGKDACSGKLEHPRIMGRRHAVRGWIIPVPSRRFEVMASPRTHAPLSQMAMLHLPHPNWVILWGVKGERRGTT